MKTSIPPTLLAAILGLLSGPAVNAMDDNVARTSMEISSAAASTAWNVPVSSVQVAALSTGYHPSDSWDDVKDYGFDLRLQLLAGLHQVEAKVDRQIADLKVRRSRMRFSTTDTQGWDLAMKEMENARYELKCRATDLANATYENWGFQKEQVGKAWRSTQEYYAKVKDSTTTQ